MAYRPRSFTTTSAAQMIVNYDANRTNMVVSNISGETCYMGVDSTVAASGNDRGVPIFNNGRFSASFMDGTDPRLERWIIGSAGGTIVIFEEAAPDPLTEATNKLGEVVYGLL